MAQEVLQVRFCQPTDVRLNVIVELNGVIFIFY